MIWFIIGLFVGACIGLFFAALANAAGDDDDGEK